MHSSSRDLYRRLQLRSGNYSHTSSDTVGDTAEEFTETNERQTEMDRDRRGFFFFSEDTRDGPIQGSRIFFKAEVCFDILNVFWLFFCREAQESIC